MINWGACFRYAYGEDCPPKESESKIPITCPYCGTHTHADIISKFVTSQNDFVHLPNSEMAVYNYFLRCTRCQSAIFILWTYGKDYRSMGSTAGRIVFPFYTDAFEAKEVSEDVMPAAIYEDLVQAEISYYSGAYLGAGLLLRRACQNICRDKKCSEKKGLLGQIDELVTNNIITKEMSEMAHSVRIIGNEIAHPNPSTPFIISRDDIKACREFLKQLIQVIYVNPHRAKIVKETLSKKGVVKEKK